MTDTPTPEQTPTPSETITLTTKQLNDIVAEQVKQFASELLAKRESDAGGSEWMQQLALTMAELTDQGTSRKRVAPEILAQRAAHHVKMVELITAAHDEIQERGLADKPEAAQDMGLVPEYQVRVQLYLDNQLVQPYQVGVDKVARPTEIFWLGVPNDGMIPINDIAKHIHDEYRASVGDNKPAEGKYATHMQYWVTAKNGLVVKSGRAPVNQTVGMMESGIPADLDRSSSMLRVRTPVNPNASTVSILGTVAPAARQTQVGTH